MAIAYVAIKALVESDRIALKATVLPILRSDKTHVYSTVAKITFVGVSNLGSICWSQEEKGRPLSRANAKVCLLVLVIVLIDTNISSSITVATRREAESSELVAF